MKLALPAMGGPLVVDDQPGAGPGAALDGLIVEAAGAPSKRVIRINLCDLLTPAYADRPEYPAISEVAA
ncbi:hypothetical protein PSEUDO9AG_60216 [Pseudomonas sp. 9Ag]|nr:hypothetical protein PSEUDO9AG_60216 [Pseudomonas sp. 9Ag]